MLFNIIKTIIHLFIFVQCVQAGITDLADMAFMNAQTEMCVIYNKSTPSPSPFLILYLKIWW